MITRLSLLMLLLRRNQYDKSGRSKGIANVEYEKVAHAVAAKEAFDGALAKGMLCGLFSCLPLLSVGLELMAG